MVLTWEMLKKILQVLNFSEENIQKVYADLEQMVHIELVSSFLVDLSEEEKKEIEKEVGDLKGEAAAEKIKNYLRSHTSESEVQEIVKDITQEILEEYGERVLSKVKDKEKKNQIQAILTESSTLV